MVDKAYKLSRYISLREWTMKPKIGHIYQLRRGRIGHIYYLRCVDEYGRKGQAEAES